MNKYLKVLKNIFLHTHDHTPGEACSHEPGAHTHATHEANAPSAEMQASFKKVLLIALILNAIMFCVQMSVGSLGQSATVLADAADFLSDSFNYAVSFFVVGASSLVMFRANILKIASMLLVSIGVLVFSFYKIFYLNTPPHTELMIASSLLAFGVNLLCVYLLSNYKADANMYAAWACSVNDMVGNVLILIVAILTIYTNSFIPDVVVGMLLCSVTIFTSINIWRKTKNGQHASHSHSHTHHH